MQKISERILRSKESEAQWILIVPDEDSRVILKNTLPKSIEQKCTVFHPMSDFVANRSRVASSVAKVAGSSMLFNLVLIDEIRDEYLDQIYKLFFHLKNLGFCRVLVTQKHKIIEEYCKNLNVYYEVISDK